MTTTNTLSTHVLDTATGRPAGNLAITLERLTAGSPERLGEGVTDADGRVRDFLRPGAVLTGGTYRLRFETGAWHAEQGVAGFYPHVEVVFVLGDRGEHYHVPLLISPFGYSTYRGS
jgi:5-hydroxyisourate hydrolase